MSAFFITLDELAGVGCAIQPGIDYYPARSGHGPTFRVGLESGETLDLRPEPAREEVSLLAPGSELVLTAQDSRALAEALDLALDWHDRMRRREDQIAALLARASSRRPS